MTRRLRYVLCTPAMLFGIGAGSWLIAMGVWYIFLGNSNLDIQLHDTYYVFRAAYIMKWLFVFFALLSAVYYLFPKLLKRGLNKPMGNIHFWMSFVSAWLILWSDWIQLRRVRSWRSTHADLTSIDWFAISDRLVLIGLSFFILAQLLFIFIVVYSAFRSRKGVEIVS